ncbi:MULTISPECIES: hypothetical protein [unclassified Acinetobacter]|uniref:hypothetical protein n=1 Tax=unclassified Acinetobacter TaxID=196816 RepID=UPI00190B475E|nr:MULTISPECIES: hypothetical protein [unclassified Acinetobacter]MBK0063937.1 hypothetical protein [Acinetobacter sp. S55]MBK0067222.1 hypothetical protein [Acinetobacter sp. S54]
MKKTLKFTEELHQAILDGEKFQTRRVIKPESNGTIIGWGGDGIAIEEIPTDLLDTQHVRTVICPYMDGDVVWANGKTALKITSIRVACLHDISHEDAIAEGCVKYGPFDEYRGAPHPQACMRFRAYRNPKDAFKNLWEHINGSDSWKENPWVWVISFKVLGHED